MNFDSSIIQDIKTRLDIVEIASRFMEVKQHGNRWVCLCPFHNETKPSFYLNRELGLYYCFGCQASGDVIDLYCKLKGIDFIEGIKDLAEEVGVKLDKDPSSGFYKKAHGISKREYLKLYLLAHNYFRAQLKSNLKAFNYLKDRNIPGELIEKFELGYAPDRWDGLRNFLKKYGYKEELAVSAGLLSKKATRAFDRFRDRIIFPIMDVGGDIVGFGGRIIGEGEPKYLNTGETPYFKKSRILYGLFQAKKAISSNKEVIITEGYIDLITLFQYGFENSCAVLGTALTEDHAKRLATLCEKIFLVFDGDNAGRRASFRSAEILLSKGLEVRVVKLPENEDIDSFLKQNDRENFYSIMKNSQEGLEFCVKTLKELSPKTSMGWCVKFLKGIDDLALRAYYLPRLSHILDISETFLRRAVESDKFNKKYDAQNAIFDEVILPFRDKEFLSFAINYPRYINLLDKEKIYEVFDSALGKSLWKKIVKYGHEDIMYYLDKDEKNIYVQLVMTPHKFSSEKEQLCKEIIERIRKIRLDQKKYFLRKEIRQAEKDKDFNKLKSLLNEYNKHIKIL